MTAVGNTLLRRLPFKTTPDKQIQDWKAKWRRGAENGWAGAAPAANPFRSGSSGHSAWVAGWNWAKNASGSKAAGCSGTGPPSSPDERYDRAIGPSSDGECGRPLGSDTRGRPLGHSAPTSSSALAARGERRLLRSTASAEPALRHHRADLTLAAARPLAAPHACARRAAARGARRRAASPTS